MHDDSGTFTKQCSEIGYALEIVGQHPFLVNLDCIWILDHVQDREKYETRGLR